MWNLARINLKLIFLLQHKLSNSIVRISLIVGILLCFPAHDVLAVSPEKGWSLVSREERACLEGLFKKSNITISDLIQKSISPAAPSMLPMRAACLSLIHAFSFRPPASSCTIDKRQYNCEAKFFDEQKPGLPLELSDAAGALLVNPNAQIQIGLFPDANSRAKIRQRKEEEERARKLAEQKRLEEERARKLAEQKRLEEERARKLAEREKRHKNSNVTSNNAPDFSQVGRCGYLLAIGADTAIKQKDTAALAYAAKSLKQITNYSKSIGKTDRSLGEEASKHGSCTSDVDRYWAGRGNARTKKAMEQELELCINLAERLPTSQRPAASVGNSATIQSQKVKSYVNVFNCAGSYRDANIQYAQAVWEVYLSGDQRSFRTMLSRVGGSHTKCHLIEMPRSLRGDEDLKYLGEISGGQHAGSKLWGFESTGMGGHAIFVLREQR